MERRFRRSEDPQLSLQYLIEALAGRSEVSSVALVRSNGEIVAGAGENDKVRTLAAIAGPLSRGEPCPAFEEVTAGTDFLGRALTFGHERYFLAALGTRLRRMPEALAGISRILGCA